MNRLWTLFLLAVVALLLQAKQGRRCPSLGFRPFPKERDYALLSRFARSVFSHVDGQHRMRRPIGWSRVLIVQFNRLELVAELAPVRRETRIGDHGVALEAQTDQRQSFLRESLPGASNFRRRRVDPGRPLL